jgi:hypothetical protein
MFMALSSTLVSCDDYIYTPYTPPSTPSTPSTPTTTTLSGTYYAPNNAGYVTFYRDGTFYIYSTLGSFSAEGTYSVSGSRIRIVDEYSGDVLYWTIVDSTTIRDQNGTRYTKA